MKNDDESDRQTNSDSHYRVRPPLSETTQTSKEAPAKLAQELSHYSEPAVDQEASGLTCLTRRISLQLSDRNSR